MSVLFYASTGFIDEQEASVTVPAVVEHVPFLSTV